MSLMMFLDVCIVLVGFSLLVAWYVPDDVFKVDSGEGVPVRVRTRARGDQKPRR